MPGIFVGIDGSASSQRALEWAVRHAGIEHAPLTALAVHQVVASQWTGEPISDARDRPEQEQTLHAAQAMVDKTISTLGDPRPASVTVRAVSGHPAEALIDASNEADLLVVGKRGAGGFTSLLTGSITSQVVNHSACPVVVVR
jgi:nucleotide-binding universal stress UspA family protein